MERETRQKLSLRKVGGGTLRLRNGKIIKPNQSFEEYLDNIPETFRNTIVYKPTGKKLDQYDGPEQVLHSETEFELQEAEPQAVLDADQEGQPEYVLERREYEKRERETAGWFDVMDAETEEPVNNKALREDEADALLEESLLWNVVNATSGKAMNDRPLERREAEELYEALR